MQNDSGLRRILTRAWAYNGFQTLVGATRGKKWVSENFWKAQPGQKVVDIGCGPGNVIRHLPRGVKYIGFDVSEKYIGHARQEFAGDAEKIFLVGSAEDFVANLPDPMRNADLVIMSGLLHHLMTQRHSQRCDLPVKQCRRTAVWSVRKRASWSGNQGLSDGFSSKTADAMCEPSPNGKS